MWQYLISIILIAIGYPLGKLIAKTVPDELKEKKYILIIRDAMFLFAIAITAFGHNKLILQYVLPLIVIISYFWFAKYFEVIYPYLFPIIIFFSNVTNEIFITNTALLFIATFISGAVNYKHKSWIQPALLIVGLILGIVKFII